MIFDSYFDEKKNETVNKCCGFSMKSFIEEEKLMTTTMNSMIGTLAFQDLVIPFVNDSHDKGCRNLYENKKGGDKKGGGKKGEWRRGNMSLPIPNETFDKLFGLVAEVLPIGKSRTTRRRRHR